MKLKLIAFCLGVGFTAIPQAYIRSWVQVIQSPKPYHLVMKPKPEKRLQL